jgi:uncharacterized protein
MKLMIRTHSGRAHSKRPAALFAAGSILLALAAVPAMAQQKAPAAAAAPAAPATPAAPAFTPSHLAVAAEVVQLSGITRSFNFVIPQFSEQMKQMFGTTRPEIATELAAALTSLQPEFEAQKADLVTATNRIVASTMSESELKEVAAFMKTPTGMKYVESQPKIVDALFGEMELWSRKLSDFMLTRVRAELKKKNIEL